MNKKQPIRLVIVDLDGTLLNSQHQISVRSQEALAVLNQKKIPVVISTGRSLHGTLKIFDFHESSWPHPVSMYNGAMIARGKSTLHEIALKHDIVARAIKVSLDHGFSVCLQSKDQVFIDDPNHQLLRSYNLARFQPTIVDNLFDVTARILKVTVLGEPKLVLDFLAQCQQSEYLRDFSVVAGSTNLVDFTAVSATKKTSAEWLSFYLGVASEEIMAIGDQSNDLEMIRWAGVGVAMGNAIDAVKEVANFISKDNDADGVVYALEQHGLL